MKSIKEANIARRLLAMIMDAVIFFFTWGLLIAFVFMPIGDKSFKYTELMNEGTQRQVFSSLYVCSKEDGDSSVIIEIPEYTTLEASDIVKVYPLYESKSEDIVFYLNRLHYYYLNYKLNNDIAYPVDLENESLKPLFYDSTYNEPIKDESGAEIAKSDYYTESWFNQNFGSIDNAEDARKAVYSATEDFYYSKDFSEINSKLKKIQLFFIVPSYILSFGIYYLMFPLIFRNGETLGKKTMHMAFVTKDGYDIKKRQIIMRQLLLFLWVSLFTFGIGVGFTSIATLGLGVAIYLIITLFNKQRRSPIDLAAYTLLCDARTSVWFNSPMEEQTKEENLEKKMEAYKSRKVENKNIIQIEDQVIDENIKNS